MNDSATPDQIYGELFVDVQMARIFSDGKTFVDCVPKSHPADLLAEYLIIKKAPPPNFSIRQFVEDHFNLPAGLTETYHPDTDASVKSHIRLFWDLLKRQPDKGTPGSSLFPLPYPYVMPGGIFREVYYWDSYFIMLGLQEQREFALVESMTRNFAHLIDRYGYIPNGNRNYYLGRSQPPFFSLMVDLLAETKGPQVYEIYLPSLEKEYAYWMRHDPQALRSAGADRCVALVDGHWVNRYWDEFFIPRQESHCEDIAIAKRSHRPPSVVYNHLRAGCASGWDFSSRWLADGVDLSTIQTADLVPVDLQCLLYALERRLFSIHRLLGNEAKASFYRQKAESRLRFLNQYCWNGNDGCYYDYHLVLRRQVREPSLATVFPLFFRMASAWQAQKVARLLRRDFLRPGGLVTTLRVSGHQWDAPNGWAPLHWIAVQGLEHYGYHTFAHTIARRWAQLNIDVFHRTGKLLEKYNVVDPHLPPKGDEYPLQDGFGWTNGVLIHLMNQYGIEDPFPFSSVPIPQQAAPET